MIDICCGNYLSDTLKEIRRKLRSKEILVPLTNLTYGPLNGDILEAQAKREADTLWYCYSDVTEAEVEECYEDLLDELHAVKKALNQHFENGETFRIWISNTARDRCTLYWFCNLAKEYENPIQIVYQPKYEYFNFAKRASVCISWELVNNPNLYVEYAEQAEFLTADEKQAYVREWNRIVSENAPMRILIDNTIVGVSENFFDETILGFVSEEPSTQTSVMGKMLGKWQGGCDVDFISQRIEHLIESGKIKVCEEKVDEEGCYWARTIMLA